MTVLITILLATLVAFTITFLSVPSLIKVAEQKHLYDEPDTERKVHIKKIPTLGGVAIFGGAMIALTFFIDFSKNPEVAYALSAVIILFFTGVKDDIIPLSASKKFFAQIIASLIVILKCDIRLTNLYGFLWIEDINSSFSILVTLFTMLVIINSFNLIDGINGLAGGIAVIVFTVFGYLFYLLEDYNYTIISASLVGALLGFLYYNFRRDAQIFMGDTGSLMIGVFSSILALEFIEMNKQEYFFKVSFAPLFAFTILIIPLFDTLRVFLIRMSKGNSPFLPDKNHLHHYIIALGFSHRRASVLLYLTNIAFIILAFMLNGIYQLTLLGIVLGLSLALSYLLFYLKSRHETNTRKKVVSEKVNKTAKTEKVLT